MKRKVFGIVFLLCLLAVGGFSKNILFDGFLIPGEVSAQQAPTNNDVFSNINTMAKQNKANPSFEKSRDIANAIFDHLSVIEIPKTEQDAVAEQIATAHLNQISGIDETNAVTTLNNLALQTSAPDYAYVSAAQVRVTRTFLNRLMPDLVSSEGSMSDLETFAVFTATLSQKVDNSAFMVTPAEFDLALSTPNNTSQFPGGPMIGSTMEVNQETAKSDEMRNVLNNYASLKNRPSSQNIITMLGIQ